MKILKIVWQILLSFYNSIILLFKRMTFDFDIEYIKLEQFVRYENMKNLDNQVIYYKKFNKLSEYAVTKYQKNQLLKLHEYTLEDINYL